MSFDLFLKTNFQDSNDYTSIITDFAMTPYRSLFGGFEVTHLNLDSRTVNFKEITPYHRQYIGAKKYILTAIAIILLVPATIAGAVIKGFQYATSPLVAEKYRSFSMSKFFIDYQDDPSSASQIQRFKHPHDLKFLLNLKDPELHQFLEQNLSEEQLHIFVDHFLSENPTSIPKNIFYILPNRVETIHYFFLSLTPEQLEGLPPYNEIPSHFLLHFFSLLNCDRPLLNKINLNLDEKELLITVAKRMMTSFTEGSPEFRRSFKELIKSIHPSNIPSLLEVFFELFTYEKIDPLEQREGFIGYLSPLNFFDIWYPIRTNENLANDKIIKTFLRLSIKYYVPTIITKENIKDYLLNSLIQYCELIEPFFCFKPFQSPLLSAWPRQTELLEQIFSVVPRVPSLSDLCRKVVQNHSIPLKDEDLSNLGVLLENSVVSLPYNYDYKSKFSLALKEKTLSILEKIKHCLDIQGDLESLIEEIAQKIIKDKENGAFLIWWFSQQDHFKNSKLYSQFIRSVVNCFNSNQLQNLFELYRNNSCIPTFEAAIFPFLPAELRDNCFSFLFWNRTLEFDLFVDGQSYFSSSRSSCRIDVSWNEINKFKRTLKKCLNPVNTSFLSLIIRFILRSTNFNPHDFEFHIKFISKSIHNYSTRELFTLINYFSENNIDLKQAFKSRDIPVFPVVSLVTKGLIPLFKEFDPKSYPYFLSILYTYSFPSILREAIDGDVNENKLLIKSCLDFYVNEPNAFIDLLRYENIFSRLLKNNPDFLPISLIRSYFTYLKEKENNNYLKKFFKKITDLGLLKDLLKHLLSKNDKTMVVEYLKHPFEKGVSIFGQYQSHKLSDFFNSQVILSKIFCHSSFKKWKSQKIDEGIDENLKVEAEMKVYSKIIPYLTTFEKRHRPIILHFFKKYCIIMDACT